MTFDKRKIVTLLLKQNGLFKGVKFKNHKYIGDPLNTIRIYNKKKVDELILLDIEANLKNKEPNYELLSKISKESEMPFAYGGGLKDIEVVKKITRLGVEKISINTALFANTSFVDDCIKYLGSQSVMASIDLKKTIFGNYKAYSHSGKVKNNINIKEFVKNLEQKGIGEILLNFIDRDGKMCGTDLNYGDEISKLVNIPMVISGGISGVEEINKIFKSNISAIAASSLFIFNKEKEVLINYPLLNV